MRNTVWNLGFISYSKERKRKEQTQFGSNHLSGWNSVLHFFLPKLQPPLLLLPIFRWTAEMLKFKLHECASYLSLTRTVLVQYLPTHPSYIKVKSSGCLTQWRLSCKCDRNSAQRRVSAAAAGSQGCCPPWKCAMMSWTQSPADVPAQSTKTHPLEKIQGVMWKMLICSSWQRGSTLYQLHTERGAGRVFWIPQAPIMEKGWEQSPFM